MQLTVYERAVALQELFKEKSFDYAMEEMGLTIVPVNSFYSSVLPSETMVMKRALESFKNKTLLSKEKDKVLFKISDNIQKMSDSNAEVLNLAFETARKAFKFRQDLELSVLNSQLKQLEVEILQIKTLTAEEFLAKYGA